MPTDRQLAEQVLAVSAPDERPLGITIGESKRIARALIAALDTLAAAERENTRLRKALEAADAALMDARNGLDLGLGCAREAERDWLPRPQSPRSQRQDGYLQRARQAHRKIQQALSTSPSCALSSGEPG